MFSAKFGFGSNGRAPTAPTAWSATAGNGAAIFIWYPPAYDGGTPINTYVVQYSANGGGTWIDAGFEGTLLRAWISGLSNGVTYRFRVAARNSIGTSAFTTNVVTATTSAAFTPVAVLRTFNNSYTIPAGATIMKAWAIGPGSRPTSATTNRAGGAGGIAYGIYPVTGGTTLTYNVSSSLAGLTPPDSTTLIGYAGSGNAGGAFDSTEGSGVYGGEGTTGIDANGRYYAGGAVGGNNTPAACGRRTAHDVFGVVAALTLAGQYAPETCAPAGGFGSGAYDAVNSIAYAAGIGGGGTYPFSAENIDDTPGGTGAVVMYFA